LVAELKRKGMSLCGKDFSRKEARPAPTPIAVSTFFDQDDVAGVPEFGEGFELGV
jgi:hypothetical protein